MLRLLISQYGAKEVAKAAQVFVDGAERIEILKQSKQEIERIIDTLDKEL